MHAFSRLKFYCTCIYFVSKYILFIKDVSRVSGVAGCRSLLTTYLELIGGRLMFSSRRLAPDMMMMMKRGL